METHEAFAYCQRLARDHYENFPVASFLVPRAQRRFVACVYAFARTADDFADEGVLAGPERLRNLDDWEEKLVACFAGEADHPVFIALRATIEATDIPQEPLRSLLRAFKMDAVGHRYQTFDELLEYCAHSANPVGRLVLHLFGQATDTTLPMSDHICTALQLTNFWQDVAVDFAKGRIYIPLEDFDRFGYTEEDLGRGRADDRFRALLRFQLERTRRLFRAGEPLIGMTGGRLRHELALTVSGGMAILDSIERTGYDTLSRRPTLSAGDTMFMFWQALSPSRLWTQRHR